MSQTQGWGLYLLISCHLHKNTLGIIIAPPLHFIGGIARSGRVDNSFKDTVCKQRSWDIQSHL